MQLIGPSDVGETEVISPILYKIMALQLFLILYIYQIYQILYMVDNFQDNEQFEDHCNI